MTLRSEKQKNVRKYDDITIVEVWKKAIPVSHFEMYKKDVYGSLMFFDDFGIESELGWVIGYIKTQGEGGSDDLENLQPLHWKNNKNKY